MAETGKVNVTVDDERITERLAQAWDEGWMACDFGTWCVHHEQNDFCAWGHMNPWRTSQNEGQMTPDES
jgi:DNA-binding GntR family transcriptional regulator